MHTTPTEPQLHPVGKFWSNKDPFVIWPYYTGRDKGVLRHRGEDGITRGILTFFNEGQAWKYISEMPGDDRRWDNYRVVRLSEYVA